MAGETTISVVGTVTADPEMRFLPNGTAVCSFTIASNSRQLDKTTNTWKDDPNPLFLRCSAWRQLGENCAESLSKGTRVIAQGHLKMRNYETREGEKRTSTELDVQAIGPDLRWATAKVVKVERSGGLPGGSQGQGYSQQGAQQQAPAQRGPAAASVGADDPWAQPAGGYDSGPPF
jgi:single-strand DNA-binding protein